MYVLVHLMDRIVNFRVILRCKVRRGREGRLSDLGLSMALKFLNLIICGEALLFVYLGFPTVYCQGFIFLGVG